MKSIIYVFTHYKTGNTTTFRIPVATVHLQSSDDELLKLYDPINLLSDHRNMFEQTMTGHVFSNWHVINDTTHC